jgi:hypothetical protein
MKVKETDTELVKRIKLAWHVITGKPLMYGIHFNREQMSGVTLKDATRDTWLVDVSGL